eukprot:g2433.t1
MRSEAKAEHPELPKARKRGAKGAVGLRQHITGLNTRHTKESKGGAKLKSNAQKHVEEKHEEKHEEEKHEEEKHEEEKHEEEKHEEEKHEEEKHEEEKPSPGPILKLGQGQWEEEARAILNNLDESACKAEGEEAPSQSHHLMGHERLVSESTEWQLSDGAIIQMVGMLLLGALLIIGVYFTAASAAHHKGPLYQGIGGVAICSVYGCLIHYHVLKLRARQRSALFCGG